MKQHAPLMHIAIIAVLTTTTLALPTSAEHEPLENPGCLDPRNGIYDACLNQVRYDNEPVLIIHANTQLNQAPAPWCGLGSDLPCIPDPNHVPNRVSITTGFANVLLYEADYQITPPPAVCNQLPRGCIDVCHDLTPLIHCFPIDYPWTPPITAPIAYADLDGDGAYESPAFRSLENSRWIVYDTPCGLLAFHPRHIQCTMPL